MNAKDYELHQLCIRSAEDSGINVDHCKLSFNKPIVCNLWSS